MVRVLRTSPNGRPFIVARREVVRHGFFEPVRDWIKVRTDEYGRHDPFNMWPVFAIPCDAKTAEHVEDWLIERQGCIIVRTLK